MRSKYLLLIFVMVSSSIYGQTIENIVVNNSKTIKIIGNSVYRAHSKMYITKAQDFERTDSTSINYSKLFVLDVLFKTSKSEILSKSYGNLNKLSVLLKDNPEMRIKINGHTDKIGNSKSNLKLSKKRAKAIKKYLKRNGVKNRNIVIEGFGDKFPICESPCNENRRVEFEFVVPKKNLSK